ncbi:MAG TPA: hypothetical protein VFR86_31855 [Burkholderiaceae bacterium]|nr:hypothetical protein [Burkholderiaceae bacterium]
MTHSKHKSRIALMFMPAAMCVALAACGGGGGGGGEAPPPEGTPAPAPSPDPGPTPAPTPSPDPGPSPAPAPGPSAATLSGAVADGGAIQGASVSIRDKDGDNACVEPVITTAANGTYTCTVASDATAPFAVLATDPAGAKRPLVSLGLGVPPAGQTATVNVTQVTSAILAGLSPDGHPATLVQDPATYGAVTADQLNAMTAPVVQQLSKLLEAAGLTADQIANFSPFTTVFAADQSGVDSVLDQLRYEFWQVLDNGRLRSNWFLTTQQTGNGVYAVARPGAAFTTLNPQPAQWAPGELNFIKNGFEACFAKPVAERVLAKNDTIPLAQGGPAVTQTDPACQTVAHSSFNHNGYSFGQYFYKWLNDPNMDGARFYVPEVVRVHEPGPANAPQPRATLNIKWVNNKGVADHVVLQVRKFPGETAGRNTDWWLWGNQRRQAELDVFTLFSRHDQLASNLGQPSRFETGFAIPITAVGPGSFDTRVGSPTIGLPLRAARVKGGGLPANGLVLTRPDGGVCDQTKLVIANKTGTVDGVSSAGNNGYVFKLQRADANGNVLPNPSAPDWADAPPPFGPGTTVAAFGTFSIELFYGDANENPVVITLGTHTAADSATIGPRLKWNVLTGDALKLLDPASGSAGAASTLNVAWTQNLVADFIRSVGVFARAGGTRVEQPAMPVGALTDRSVAVNAPGAGCAGGSEFPALDTSGNTSRTFRLNHQLLKESVRFHEFSYN